MSTSETNRSRPQQGSGSNQNRGGNSQNRRRNNNRNRSGGGNRNRSGQGGQNQGGGGGGGRGGQNRQRNRSNRGGGGGQRQGGGNRQNSQNRSRRKPAPKKPSLGQKILSIITFGLIKPDDGAKKPSTRKRPTSQIKKPQPQKKQAKQERTRQRTDPASVNTPRLHVGNLSYDATEEDLMELFNGVGSVQEAEVVAHSRTHRSKGFAFVTMNTVDEARRAVEILDDKTFMGRKLTIGGARSQGRRDRDDEKDSTPESEEKVEEATEQPAGDE